MHYDSAPMLPITSYLAKKISRQLLVFLGLFLHFSPLLAQETIIVSGAGPAGLATAISLRRQGADVLLVEQRSFEEWGSRPQVLGLSQENKTFLVSLGLSEDDFNTVQQFSFHRANNLTANKPPQASPAIQIPYGRLLQYLTRPVLSHNPEEFIVIGELEKKLLARFMELGGKVSFDSRISQLSNGVADVENTKKWVIHETPYKWMINCEGAHSEILRQLKQERVVDESWPTLFMSGEKNDGKEMPEVRFSLRPQGASDFVSAFMVTDGKNFSAGLDMRGLNYEDIDPESNFGRYLSDLGLSPDTVKSVRTSRIQITQSHLERFYFSDHRVFVIGDAAHTVNPLIAYGVNLALQEAKHIGQILATSRPVSAKALEDFERFMKKNVADSQKMNHRYMSQSRLLTQGPALITQPLLRVVSSLASCKQKLSHR